MQYVGSSLVGDLAESVQPFPQRIAQPIPVQHTKTFLETIELTVHLELVRAQEVMVAELPQR